MLLEENRIFLSSEKKFAFCLEIWKLPMLLKSS